MECNKPSFLLRVATILGLSPFCIVGAIVSCQMWVARWEIVKENFNKKVAFVDDKHIVLISKLSFANFPGGKFRQNEFALHWTCNDGLFSPLLFSSLLFPSLLFSSFGFVWFLSFSFSFLFFSLLTFLVLFFFFSFLFFSFFFLFFLSFSPAQLTNSICASNN